MLKSTDCVEPVRQNHGKKGNALNTNRYYLFFFHNIDVTTMCSVKNVNSHASLTISCIVNCRQSQYFQIVGGPKSNYGDKMMVTVADPGKGGGPRNMKSMQLPSAAIFFMTNFYRAG